MGRNNAKGTVSGFNNTQKKGNLKKEEWISYLNWETPEISKKHKHLTENWDLDDEIEWLIWVSQQKIKWIFCDDKTWNWWFICDEKWTKIKIRDINKNQANNWDEIEVQVLKLKTWVEAIVLNILTKKESFKVAKFVKWNLTINWKKIKAINEKEYYKNIDNLLKVK